MKKSILFLDLDGVICLSSNWGSRHKKQKEWRRLKSSIHPNEMPVEYRFDNFDQKAVKILNEILEETGAEIVLSSDWRLYATLEELGEYFLSKGIIKKPIDMTDKYKNIYPSEFSIRYNSDLNFERYMEIQYWLDNNPEVTHWVAVDDLLMSVKYLADRFSSNNGSDKKPGLTNFVWTPFSDEGIKQTGIKEKIVKYLINNV
jgi:hypothetical protein